MRVGGGGGTAGPAAPGLTRGGGGGGVRDGRLHRHDGPRRLVAAPEPAAQVLGVGDGAAAVQQRALHERRGVLQGPRLARRQPAQAAVGGQRERRPFVEAEVPVRRDGLLLVVPA